MSWEWRMEGVVILIFVRLKKDDGVSERDEDTLTDRQAHMEWGVCTWLFRGCLCVVGSIM